MIRLKIIRNELKIFNDNNNSNKMKRCAITIII